MCSSESKNSSAESPAEPNCSGGGERLNRTDYRNALWLAFWTLGLNSLGLGSLEFIRHTEADRTLISWEMAESGSYLVPHLVHSEILTKPPLYYWSLAGLINLFGPPSEFLARVPSLICSVLFVVIQYLFLRRVRCSQKFSLLSALFLSTSFLFFVLSVVAEIDMMFGLLCALVLYAGYLAISENSFNWTCFAYLAFAVAFLVKGPPIVFFFGASQLIFFVVDSITKGESITRRLGHFLAQNLAGLCLALLLLLLWLLPLANQVSWQALGNELRVEVIERVVEDLRHERGPLFYVVNGLGNLLPWTVLLVVGAAIALFEKKEKDEKGNERSDYPQSLLNFSLIVSISGIVMLTLASGKTARYLFPIHAFLVNLTAIAALKIKDTKAETALLGIGQFLGLLIIAATPVVPFVVKLEGVPTENLVSSAIVAAVVALVLTLSCTFKQRTMAIASVALLMLAARFGETEIYAAQRNATRTVKPVAQAVNDLVPGKTPVYTIEMFERWVTFYLKQLGRETYRLTPENMVTPKTYAGRCYVLLNAEEEYWRVKEISYYDSTMKVLGTFTGGKEHFILLELAPEALPYFQPDEVFPTEPSKPFSKELKRLAL